ncbi:unnamed protein product [Cuscuta campestris]|uniref:C2HC zinc finger plants domain-containing protein n=1 Tax=Cuscuta campestris TaxID=132261 RepID=A0A484KR68_9ASTE|nr:unnamed protein product [Cuscuta campestris]
MDGTDSDMIEVESSPAQPVRPPPSSSSGPDQDEFVRNLLAMARRLIGQNEPSQALHAVVMAIRSRGGDEAVHQLLSRARELYTNKVQASAAADQLASLFSEFAIAEVATPKYDNGDQPIAEIDKSGTSILSETGRKQVMVDAFSDGSSFVCYQCGGLVSTLRKDEHYSFWCCKM